VEFWEQLDFLDTLGAVTAAGIYLVCILIFAARLLRRPDLGHKLGWALFLAAAPLAILLFEAPAFGREALYYVQLLLMLGFLVLELALDYVLRLDFRRSRWGVIGYVVFFFAATGGMLGVALKGGPVWMVITLVLFFVMAALAFIQRRVTGM